MSRGGLNDWPLRPVQTSAAAPSVSLLEEPLIGRAHDDTEAAEVAAPLYTRGSFRLGLGLLGTVVMASGAEYGAPTPTVLLDMAGCVLIGVWGGLRMEHGPSLPRLDSWWSSTRVNPANWPARRHALVLARARR